MSKLKYTLDYIVKENEKYYAHLRQHEPNGVSKVIHTGVMFGWSGMSYKELKKTLSNYNIDLPQLKDLTLFKQTQYRKCYIIH